MRSKACIFLRGFRAARSVVGGAVGLSDAKARSSLCFRFRFCRSRDRVACSRRRASSPFRIDESVARTYRAATQKERRNLWQNLFKKIGDARRKHSHIRNRKAFSDDSRSRHSISSISSSSTSRTVGGALTRARSTTSCRTAVRKP